MSLCRTKNLRSMICIVYENVTIGQLIILSYYYYLNVDFEHHICRD